MEDIMAGGRRIDDHGSWISADGKAPMDSKIKNFSSAEGAGDLNDYYDTSEKIKDKQEMNIRKAKSQAAKSGYSN